jgi:hypothetical protein
MALSLRCVVRCIMLAGWAGTAVARQLVHFKVSYVSGKHQDTHGELGPNRIHGVSKYPIRPDPPLLLLLLTPILARRNADDLLEHARE